ncbi:MAG: phospholipid carrier-dependent glycosyltransferase [bacterium]|nr:phospholipid carrier-dependent glycosyltransferase [bacterium]
MALDKLFSKRKIFLFILLFLVALAPRLYKIADKNVWMDEGKQAKLAAVHPFNFNLAQRAAPMAQPPLDYFLQSIAIKNFGLNETGIRIHAAVLGALAAVLFFLLVRRITRHDFAALLGTLFFIFHPSLIRYSQEGRPVADGIFFSLLYLYILVDYLHPIPPVKNQLRSFAVLTAVQTGFLLCLGFQPLIFLMVSSICLLPGLFNKKKRGRVFQAYLSSAIAAAISLPIIKMTITHCAGTNFVTDNSITDIIKNIFHGFQYITVNEIRPFYQTILGSFGLFFVVAAIAGIAGLILSTKNKNHTFAVSYFPLFFLIFPFVYIIVYKSQIPIGIMHRFYLTFAPVCLAVITIAIAFSLRLGQKTASFSKPWKHAPVILLALLFVFSFIPNMNAVSQYYKSKKPEWKKMYETFLYDSEPGDIAYMMNLVYIGKWNPYFRVEHFYYNDGHERPVALRQGRYIPKDVGDPEMWKQERNIYIVTRAGSEKINKKFFSGFKTVDVFTLGRLSFIRVKRGSTTREDFVSVLRALKAKLPRHESNHLLYLLLIEIDLDEGNIQRAKENLDILASIDSRKKLTKEISGFKKRIPSFVEPIREDLQENDEQKK